MDKRSKPSPTAGQASSAGSDPLLLEPAEREALGRPWQGAEPSPLEELLLPSSLETEAYPVIFARGQAYAESGKILHMELFERAVAALVGGSADEAYKVRLGLSQEKSAPPALDGCSCSCPFAQGETRAVSFCKHMIATGLAAGFGYARIREAFLIGQAAPHPSPHADAPRKSGLRI